MSSIPPGFRELTEAIGFAAANGPWFDAKSIVKVMAAKAPKNTVLYFRAEGDDAAAALTALITLVERDFVDEA